MFGHVQLLTHVCLLPDCGCGGEFYCNSSGGGCGGNGGGGGVGSCSLSL